MKRDRSVSGVCAGAAFACLLACGCSTSGTRAAKAAGEQAALDQHTATTQLMSAQVAGPAPKVGKSHLAVEEAEDASAHATDELGAPKEARRSNSSHRGGDFGTTK